MRPFATTTSVVLSLAFLASSVLGTSSDSAGGPGGAPPPTSPARPPPPATLPAAAIEACLAPPSAQAANRAYVHWLANCQVTRPCAAATADGSRTAYGEAEVQALRDERRPEWDGQWPAYRPPPLVELVEDDGVGFECEMEPNVGLMRIVGGEVARDEQYASFLAGVETIATPRARVGLGGGAGGGWATNGGAVVPEQVLPLVIGVALLLARIAGVRGRPVGAANANRVEGKRIDLR